MVSASARKRSREEKPKRKGIRGRNDTIGGRKEVWAGGCPRGTRGSHDPFVGEQRGEVAEGGEGGKGAQKTDSEHTWVNHRKSVLSEKDRYYRKYEMLISCQEGEGRMLTSRRTLG